MNIVFFGTPDLAASVLGVLINSRHRVLAAVSQPDRPSGRGKSVHPTPVKAIAENHGIPVLSPETVRDASFVSVLREIPADIYAVAAFGQILPRRILAIPKFGCVNVHTSLLPKYRGASPAACAIRNGDAMTGVTIMQMDAGMDTGDILHVKKLPIMPEDTAGSLTDKLAVLGGPALLEALERLESGEVAPMPQNNEEASYAPLLTKEMGEIDFSASAMSIINLIRAMDPWPGAYIRLSNCMLKVWRAEQGQTVNAAPGSIISSKDEIVIACGTGESIRITSLQAPGGKRMDAADYLRGHVLPESVL